MRPGAAARMGQGPSVATRTDWGNCRKKIAYFGDYDLGDILAELPLGEMRLTYPCIEKHILDKCVQGST